MSSWGTTAFAALLLAGAACAVHAAPAADQAVLLEQRCNKCHNATDWAGGLAFDTLSVEDVTTDAASWEKTVRKLRGRLMPPPGEPQPDQHSIDSLVSYLETRLDASAASHPDPGHVGLHRLNRTEYAREVNRLLGLTIDATALLPKDVSSDGFDNVAATLRVSPPSSISTSLPRAP